MSEPALQLAGVHKRFGATRALDGLDLEVAAGRIVALLGPSGCGKTTALRVVAGLERPDAGTITIGGRTVAGAGVDIPPEDRRVGLVFQDYALFPHLTVARNIAYGLAHRPSGERSERIRAVLELVGLVGLEERLPSQLSGGQQQRVALARALAPEPALVLLDEPFSNLDASLRVAVREEVRSILQAAEATAVFVTHDQEEALSLADEVAVMNAGRLHQVAPPHVLYTRPTTRFVAEFVGEADVLAGRRAGRRFVDTPIGRLMTVAPVEEPQVDVVIRPESVTLIPRPSGAAVVDTIQYFGHDQLIRLLLPDGSTLRARRGPDVHLERGERVAVSVEGAVVAFPVGDRTAASA